MHISTSQNNDYNDGHDYIHEGEHQVTLSLSLWLMASNGPLQAKMDHVSTF